MGPLRSAALLLLPLLLLATVSSVGAEVQIPGDYDNPPWGKPEADDDLGQILDPEIHKLYRHASLNKVVKAVKLRYGADSQQAKIVYDDRMDYLVNNELYGYEDYEDYEDDVDESSEPQDEDIFNTTPSPVPGYVEGSGELFYEDIFGTTSSPVPDNVEGSGELFYEDIFGTNSAPVSDNVDGDREPSDEDVFGSSLARVRADPDTEDEIPEEECLIPLHEHGTPKGPASAHRKTTTGPTGPVPRTERVERVTKRLRRYDDPLPPLCSRIETTPEEAAGQAPVGLWPSWQAAPIGHWPWMVLFGWQTPRESQLHTGAVVQQIRCAGVLVGWGYALTSARCMEDLTWMDLNHYLVAILGDKVTSLPNRAYNGTFRRVRGLRCHPEADLALVQLDLTTDGLPANVRPVCLPRDGLYLPAGTQLDGVGWRVRGPSLAPEDTQLGANDMWDMLPEAAVNKMADLRMYESLILHESTLEVTDAAECAVQYISAPHFREEVPAGFGSGKVCVMGDIGLPRYCWCCTPPSAGWPLVRKRSEGSDSSGGAFELVGLSTAQFASVTEYCGRHEGGAPRLPAVYTSISAFREWIVNNITP